MLSTKDKRRSLNVIYSHVEPKVQTRWPEGMPLIRKGKFINNKLLRRNSESCLSTQVSALLSPGTYSQFVRISEEQSSFDEGYTPASTSLDESTEHNISTSLDISTHLDIVSGHFKNLFSQLEGYLESKASSQTEKNFIEKHVKDFKEHARQIDFMINELIERGQRLERFIQNRHADGNLHWADWSN